MLTKDDLRAVAEVVKTEGDLIRKDMVTKKDLLANIGILGQILKIELAATKKKITDAMKMGFKETTKAISELDERHSVRIEKLEKRVEKIEKNSSFLVF
jgi:DNA replication protein DnaD